MKKLTRLMICNDAHMVAGGSSIPLGLRAICRKRLRYAGPGHQSGTAYSADRKSS